MSDFVKIVAPDESSVAEPFRFELAGEKFELPMLTDETAPLELLPLLLIASSDEVTEHQMVEAGAAFLAYLRDHHSKLWRHLNRQKSAILWVNGLMEQWLQASGIDPKA